MHLMLCLGKGQLSNVGVVSLLEGDYCKAKQYREVLSNLNLSSEVFSQPLF